MRLRYKRCAVTPVAAAIILGVLAAGCGSRQNTAAVGAVQSTPAAPGMSPAQVAQMHAVQAQEVARRSARAAQQRHP